MRGLSRLLLQVSFLRFDSGMALDAAAQIFREDKGPAASLDSSKLTLADCLIDAGATLARCRARFGNAVSKRNVHF